MTPSLLYGAEIAVECNWLSRIVLFVKFVEPK